MCIFVSVCVCVLLFRLIHGLISWNDTVLSHFMHCSLKCAIVMPNDGLNDFFFTLLCSSLGLWFFFPLSLVCLFFRFFGAHYFSMICSLGFGWLSVYDTNYTTKFMDMNEIPKQRTSRMKLLIFIEIASRYLCCFFAFFSLSLRSSHFRCDDNNSDFAVAVGASVFLARWLWKMISTMNNINHNGPPIYFVILQSMEKTCT